MGSRTGQRVSQTDVKVLANLVAHSEASIAHQSCPMAGWVFVSYVARPWVRLLSAAYVDS